MAVYVVLILAIIETSVISTSVFASRRVFGYIFTNEKEVVDYVTKMAPLLCLNIIMDSLQGTLSGYFITYKVFVMFIKKHEYLYLLIRYITIELNKIGVARGVGWQHLGAYINLAAFYLAGIPVAAFLGFYTSLRGIGLWIGILVGAVIQLILLTTVTISTNYEKQVCSNHDFKRNLRKM